MQEKNFIEAQEIDQKFRSGNKEIQVLYDITLQIPRNSFTIIYGPSGSGKSTLLNVLMGLQPPSKGKVLFGGKDIYSLTPDELTLFRSQHIGMVHQANYWVKSLSVVENVALPLYFQGVERAEAQERAYAVLKQIDLHTHALKRPTVLSGGEQQRVSMARALVSNPPLIVADEPTGDLDSVTGDHIIQMLRSYQTDLKSTIVLVTHELEYLTLADHLIRIKDGRVLLIEGDDVATAAEEILEGLKQRLIKQSGGGHDIQT